MPNIADQQGPKVTNHYFKSTHLWYRSRELILYNPNVNDEFVINNNHNKSNYI
jgi:hypothetical protein